MEDEASKEGEGTFQRIQKCFLEWYRSGRTQREETRVSSHLLSMRLERYKKMAPYEKIKITEITVERNFKTIVIKIDMVIKVMSKTVSSLSRLFWRMIMLIRRKIRKLDNSGKYEKGDVIKLSAGDMIPADVLLLDSRVSLFSVRPDRRKWCSRKDLFDQGGWAKSRYAHREPESLASWGTSVISGRATSSGGWRWDHDGSHWADTEYIRTDLLLSAR